LQRLPAAILAFWLGLACVLTGVAARADESNVTADALKARLAGTDVLGAGGTTLDRATLAASYQARGYEPVWAKRSELAPALLAALAAADREGLDPESFRLSALKAALDDTSMPPIDRELLLSDRFLAYAAALAHGRLAPASVEEDWFLPPPDFESALALQRLSNGETVDAVLQSLLPTDPQYKRIRQVLVHYQALAVAGGWQPIVAKDKIEPGARGDVIVALRARLIVEGDLDPSLSKGEVYDTPLVDAMKRFQARHGIYVDGRIGANSLAALNVSAQDRVAQLRLALERLRMLPRSYPAARIMVNVPAASLVLYRENVPVLASKVVVGAIDHPTPVLSARVVSVLFNPPWNVPTSIIRKEMQPELIRDPNYFAEHHYVILGRGDGADPYGRDLNWRHTDIPGRGWRVQQEPGSWNALGGVKLELPNPEDIYLHDTPARGLFARANRAASHGCIRVEQARALASTLLGGDWSPQAIDDAIATGETKRVYLKQTIPVYIIYLSAFVDDDGTVELRDDLYGRDRRLSQALLTLQAQRTAQLPPRG
jgi:murein L,D-transpeptidase YcbB/YkuD